MAAKTASLSVNIIADAAKAKAGLKEAETAFGKFRREVGQSQGAMGKFQAAAGGAFDYVKANAMGFAAAAGAAVATFVVKSVVAFQDLSLEVGKFSAATGTSVEEASRFIEVMDDLGIESGSLQTALNKLNRAAADNAGSFQSIGAEIVRTSSGAVDVQKTFLNVVDALRNVRDPAMRAKAATEILGRGWMDLSVVIDGGAQKLNRALQSVSDSKIRTEEQAAEALRFQEDVQNLKDNFEDLSQEIGKYLIPILGDTVQRFNDLIQAGKRISDIELAGIRLGDAFSTVLKFTNPVTRGQALWDWAFGGGGEKVATVTDDMARAWKDGYQAMIDAQYAASALNEELVEQNVELEKLYSATVAAFNSDIAFEQAKRRTLDTVAEYNALLVSFVDGTYKGSNASQDLTAKTDDLYLSILNQGSAAVRAAEDLAKKTGADLTAQEAARIHREEIDKVAQTLAPDSPLRRRLRDYMLELSRIERNISTTIRTIFVEERRVINSDKAMARGGLVASPTMALIGEAGPEVVIPLRKPSRAQQLMSQTGLDDLVASNGLMSAGGVSGGGNTYISVNVEAGLVSSPDQVGQQIIDAIRRAERRSGQVFAPA